VFATLSAKLWQISGVLDIDDALKVEMTRD